MCISHELRTIYIFGGKLTNRWDLDVDVGMEKGSDNWQLSLSRSDDAAEYFSDFYAYHINTNTWNKLFVDISHPLSSNPDIQSVKSRINHSMLYDDVSWYEPAKASSASTAKQRTKKTSSFLHILPPFFSIHRKPVKFTFSAASGEKRFAVTSWSTMSMPTPSRASKRRQVSPTLRDNRPSSPAARWHQWTCTRAKCSPCCGTVYGYSRWQQVNGQWFIRTRCTRAQNISCSTWRPRGIWWWGPARSFPSSSRSHRVRTSFGT